MRIGILGTGLMADALGGQWVKAGHDIFVGGRSPDRAATLANRIGAAHGSLQEATAFGEVVLLAVPAAAAVDTVGPLDLAGRTLVDCTNAVDHKDFTLANPAMAEKPAASSERGCWRQRPRSRSASGSVAATRGRSSPPWTTPSRLAP